MARLASPHEIVRANRERVLRAAESTSTARVRGLLEDARRELASRLADARRRGLGERFTGERIRALLATIRDVEAELGRRMQAQASARTTAIAERAVDDVAAYVRAMERRYAGITPELAIDTATRANAVVGAARESLLEQHETSRRTYGDHMIGEMERALRVGVVSGATTDQMIDSLVGTRAAAGWRPGVGMTAAATRVEGEFVRQTYWAERIARTECLLGDTPVESAVVRAVYRRTYEGDVVEIVTARGRHFSATPNHPMLTRRGWVAAGDLEEGDDLVCDARQEYAGPARDEHVAAPPATLAQVFDSLAAVGVRERRRTAPPDFHGDGMDGKVDVFRPDRELRIGRFAAIYKPLAERVFTPADLARSAFCARCARLLSVDEQPCLCGTAHGDAGIAESARDRAHAGSVRGGESFDAFASDVAANDPSRGKIAPPSRMDAPARHEGEPGGRQGTGCAGGADPSADDALVHAEPPPDDGRAHAGGVKLDRVRALRRRVFSGHVFNLSTPYGYYTINGAYTGNTMYAYNNAAWRAAVLTEREDLPGLKRIILATFDHRTAEDSKRIHGQVRGVTEPFYDPVHQKHYMHPPNRPNDREVVVPHRPGVWPTPTVPR